MPRKVVNLGRWDSFFGVVTVISAAVTTALICISTGHLEWFFDDCQSDTDKDLRFRPDMNCFGNWGHRLSLAAVIEHSLLLSQLLIFLKISNFPKWVQARKKTMEQQTIKAVTSMTNARASDPRDAMALRNEMFKS